MLKKLQHLLFPHQSNNHRPKVLHLSSLTTFVFFVCLFQIVISLVIQKHPGVLGFASNIAPEEIVRLTNEVRQKKGLAPLTLNKTLVEVAKQKGADMFAKNYWAHNNPDGTTPWYFYKNVGYSYLYAGENLARDFGDSQSVVAAWMNSPTHRDNILSSRYEEIGIAVLDGILEGEETTLVVQEFGKQTASAPQIGAVIPSSPGISLPQKALAQKPEQMVLSQAKESYIEKLPLFSSFILTKSVNTSLGLLILLVLLVDAAIVWHKQIPRISGKSLAHISFFGAVVLIVLLTGSGRVL